MRFVGVCAALLIVGAGCGHSGPSWNYVALGDSIPAGTGEAGGRGFVYDYAQYVRHDTGARVTVHNLGTNGLTAQGLLVQLRNSGDTRKLVANADIVTISIGLNDLIVPLTFAGKSCGGRDNQRCFRSALASFELNWPAILREVSQLRANHKTLLRVTTDYNAFSDAQARMRFGAGRIKVFTRYLRRYNAYRCATVRTHRGSCADIGRAFDGASGLIGGDGHPSINGHRLIARTLRALGYGPLA